MERLRRAARNRAYQARSALVAYVVGAGDAAPSASELQSYLKERLPEYMVPAAFVALAVLPLTLNGKLDRRALPEPGQESLASRRYEEPVGEVEGTIARIWQELLKVKRVGRQDNFFRPGGALATGSATGVAITPGVGCGDRLAGGV